MVVVSVIIERLAGVFLFAGARPFPLGSRSARLRRTAARPQAEPWLDSDGKTCVGSLAQQRLSATVRRSGEDNAAREYGQEWIIPTTSGSTSWLRPHKPMNDFLVRVHKLRTEFGQEMKRKGASRASFLWAEHHAKLRATARNDLDHESLKL
jgi:hypothetical protein